MDEKYYNASKKRLGIKDEVIIENIVIEKVEYIKNVTVKQR